MPAHGLEQDRGAGDVDVRVAGQVGKVHAESYHRGLVTHGVYPGQCLVDHRTVAHVADDELAADVVGPAVVHSGREGIQAAHFMACRLHGFHDVRSDEAGRTCDENAHDFSEPGD